MPLEIAGISETIKFPSRLWTVLEPHATRIYQDANELLRPVEHLTKFGHGHAKLIVFHPVDTSRDAFDQIDGSVIFVVEEDIRVNTRADF